MEDNVRLSQSKQSERCSKAWTGNIQKQEMLKSMADNVRLSQNKQSERCSKAWTRNMQEWWTNRKTGSGNVRKHRS